MRSVSKSNILWIMLPKKYISYSQVSLWKRDKSAYRRKYYDGEPSVDTAYTMFGKEIHAQIEAGGLEHVPRYSKHEHEVRVNIEDVPVIGYIDSFAPRRCAIVEYKTGIRDASNSPRWTQSKVQAHDQLPFYSMLVQQKYGKVHDETTLVWLETEWYEHESVEMFDGMELTGTERRLRLTGDIEIFKRTIEQWERDRMIEILLSTAKEISEDYERYTQDSA